MSMSCRLSVNCTLMQLDMQVPAREQELYEDNNGIPEFSKLELELNQRIILSTCWWLYDFVLGFLYLWLLLVISKPRTSETATDLGNQKRKRFRHHHQTRRYAHWWIT